MDQRIKKPTNLHVADRDESEQGLHLGTGGGDEVFGLDGVTQILGEEFDDLQGMVRLESVGEVGQDIFEHQIGDGSEIFLRQGQEHRGIFFLVDTDALFQGRSRP